MVFGDAAVTAGEAGLGIAIVTALGGAWKLFVDATKERRMKRDAMEFDAKVKALEDSNQDLASARDECMKLHAEKDGKIEALERRLDDCHRDHELSAKDREKLWVAVRAMQAGPV